MNVLEKVLILSITCPQFSDLRHFKRYQNGQWANIDIQNKDSLLPVTKKNTIIDFKTKLHAECFYYSTGNNFKNVTPLNEKISLKEISFYLNSYKLPTPSSLSITPSTTRTILSQSSPLPSFLHIFSSSLQTAITTVQTKPIASGCLKAHTFTTAHQKGTSLVSAHSTAPAPAQAPVYALAQCIGDINIVSPHLPNVCDNIYHPSEDIRQSTPISEETDVLQDISINGIPPDIRILTQKTPYAL